VRALYLAQHIALRLGHTIVAPVVAYVPEGEIKPPAGHMRFSGTISIPEATFESLLEATARSLRQHGFRDVIFIGDHGGYQKNLSKVAQKLNQAGPPIQAAAPMPCSTTIRPPSPPMWPN
jgi:creatinine amidohydrolase/Fe(II)-dependent formamide hydrolase-like protein